MMTEEQIKELATLAANVRHLVGQNDSLRNDVAGLADSIKRDMAGLATRDELRSFVTHTHHDAELKAVNVRVDSMQKEFAGQFDGLKKTIESQSPMSIWDRIVRLAAGVTAIGAMISMVFLYARKP